GEAFPSGPTETPCEAVPPFVTGIVTGIGCGYEELSASGGV
ncbi:hypothetical protein A2U01_0111337, partial [Trifolium medium]|nr:hypothetical protein [Trifolium medium]